MTAFALHAIQRKHLQVAVVLCRNFGNIVFILRKTWTETRLHTRPLEWRANTKIQHQNCGDAHSSLLVVLLPVNTSYFLSPNSCHLFELSPTFNPLPLPLLLLLLLPHDALPGVDCLSVALVCSLLFLWLFPDPTPLHRLYLMMRAQRRGPIVVVFHSLRTELHTHTHGSHWHLCATEFIRDNADRTQLTKGTPGWTFPHTLTL